MAKLLICGVAPGMAVSVREVADAGHDVYVVSERDEAVIRSASLDVLITDLAVVTASEIRAWLNDRDLDGVLTLGADAPALVSAVARLYGLHSVSEKVALRCTRKDLRIRALAAARLPVPAFAVIETLQAAYEALERIGYPAIVKPLDCSGSVGVAEIGSAENLPEHFAKALSASSTPGVLIEERLSGTEHTVGGFMLSGRLHVTGFSDRDYSRKADFYPFYFESGDTFPSALRPEQKTEVVGHVEAAARAVGIDDSVINTDVLRSEDGRVFVLEVTCRLAGARIATEVLRLGTGVDPLPHVVALALGLPVNPDELRPSIERPVVQRFLPCQGGTVRSVGPIEDVHFTDGIYDIEYMRPITPGERLPRFQDASDVLAGAIASGRTSQEAELRALQALDCLPLLIDPD